VLQGDGRRSLERGGHGIRDRGVKSGRCSRCARRRRWRWPCRGRRWHVRHACRRGCRTRRLRRGRLRCRRRCACAGRGVLRSCGTLRAHERAVQELLDAIEREGRPRGVADEALAALVVVRRDANGARKVEAVERGREARLLALHRRAGAVLRRERLAEEQGRARELREARQRRRVRSAAEVSLRAQDRDEPVAERRRRGGLGGSAALVAFFAARVVKGGSL